LGAATKGAIQRGFSHFAHKTGAKIDMKDCVPGLTVATYSLAVFALLVTTSCSKLDAIQDQTNKTRDEISKEQDRLTAIEGRLDQAGTGRFQIVVANESDRGAVLFLLDTRSGETSIYRAPQGPAINGYWSNIPRLTYSDDYWQRAFSQGQQSTPNTNTPTGAQPGSLAPRR
jgi:hypothetical protein